VLRNRIRGSVTALNKLNLFSDIRVEEDSPLALDGIVLYFTVAELPVLGKVKYKGLKKLSESDFKSKIDLIEGAVFSPGTVEASRQKILGVYRDKGYLLATADASEEADKKTGERIVTFTVEEGKKVAVRYVTFEGNDHVADKMLRKRFPIKEDRWWRSGDFREEDYRLGLDSLLDYYRELGYLDASVLRDSTGYTAD
jgi:outer membrane protein insertion porin family